MKQKWNRPFISPMTKGIDNYVGFLELTVLIRIDCTLRQQRNIFVPWETGQYQEKYFQLIDVKYYRDALPTMNITCCSNASGLQTALHWRHNDHDGVSNHQPHGCLLNGLFRRRSKKTSKLRVIGLCAGNSPGPVNSSHKGPVARKMFPFDYVIMCNLQRR